MSDLGGDNVMDCRAEELLAELADMGEEFVLHGAHALLLPNIKAKQTNAFHERRLVPNQGLVAHQARRVTTTLRFGVVADPESWLAWAAYELRKPRGDSNDRTELQQKVKSIMLRVVPEMQLWSVSDDGRTLGGMVHPPEGKTLYGVRPLVFSRTIACPPATEEQRLNQHGADIDVASPEPVVVSGAELRKACVFEMTVEFFYGTSCFDLGVEKVVQRLVLRDNAIEIASVDTPPFVVVNNRGVKSKGYLPCDAAFCATLEAGLVAPAVAGDGASPGGSAGSSMPSQDEEDEDPVEAEDLAVKDFLRGPVIKGPGGIAAFLAEAEERVDGLEALAEELGLTEFQQPMQLRASPEMQAAFMEAWSSSDDEDAPKRQRLMPPGPSSPVQRSLAAPASPHTESMTYRSCSVGDDDTSPMDAPPPCLDASPSASQPCYRGLGAGPPKPCVERFRKAATAVTKAAAVVKAMQQLKALVAKVVRTNQATPADCAALVQLRQSCVGLVQG